MRILLIVMAATLLFGGCDKESVETDSGFVGKWNLVSLSGGFSPSETFVENAVVWEFGRDEMLTVSVDDDLAENSWLVFRTDTVAVYAYDSLQVSLGDNTFEYFLEENTLRLYNNVASDGPVLEFDKQ